MAPSGSSEGASHELDVHRHQLQRNQVELLQTEGAFVDPHTVRL
mgnify:CR=1 FL=1